MAFVAILQFSCGFHVVFMLVFMCFGQDLELKEKIEALAAEASLCLLVSPCVAMSPDMLPGMSKDWWPQFISIRWRKTIANMLILC